jgi:3-deoxy-manno-octulosonate cytidylyltransferase (CMP-KDO synthetase)
MPNQPLIVIPARMASTRLPGKPLADICGKPMIVRVWERAMAANAGPVVVACSETEVADAVQAAGGHAVLTDPDLPSGSDRVWAAVQEYDPTGRYQLIVNLQGDLPTLDPKLVLESLRPLHNEMATENPHAPKMDIGTLVAEITDAEERTRPSVVKAIGAFHGDHAVGRALYFTRAAAPYGDGPMYHHIGIYSYTRKALKTFVALQPGVLEKREKLEQLRALENHMVIGMVQVDTVPLGVDTADDLEKARAAYAAKQL